MPLGAIDVGSNTVRLMIGEQLTGRTFDIVEREQSTTRLGQGMGGSRRLNRKAIARTVEVLSDFGKRLEEFGVTRYRAVATSAVRESVNADDFINTARLAGIEVEVISGIQEARLVVDGIIPTVRDEEGDLIVVDIGGGSTEFVHVDNGNIIDIVSTDLGVVRLTESMITNDPPTHTEIDHLLNYVEKKIETVYNRFIVTGGTPRLAGTAGTVTTLAAVDLSLDTYDPCMVEGRILSPDRVDDILGEFLTMTSRQRLEHYPVMTRGREDVIIAGTIILKNVMKCLGASGLIVSDRGILEGIIAGLIEPANV